MPYCLSAVTPLLFTYVARSATVKVTIDCPFTKTLYELFPVIAAEEKTIFCRLFDAVYVKTAFSALSASMISEPADNAV